MPQSESILELGKALIKVQAALRENGLALVQSPVPTPEYLGTGFIGLETKLIHAESGEWLSSVMPIPLAKSDPQAMGAAISYGRRYALSAMLGIMTEEDGDCETRRLEPKRQENQIVSQTGNPPNLSGVNYDYQKGQDGREYIVATGNTREYKEVLKQAGFSWNSQRNFWYKVA